ncbi:MAG: molecular chaperone TorD family protein [Candidatus Thiodiazotropha sp. (ex Lucina pensylvanica)]|nr:molecular chaperone TorD family protein [Candidatus Thiodiazotropha sp. (ex Lucina pensylvanica)]
MENLQNDVQRRHQAKADACRMLSACYYEPEEAFLEEDIFGQLEQALSALDSEYAAAAQVMGACFREISYEDLRIDYTRLFLGPFNIRSKPYGSVYLDRGNIVMGDTTMAVLALYREGGFHVAEAFTEMPDHVAVELEFLYLLNARLGDSHTESNERNRLAELERSLLDEHLGQWIVPFTEAMKEGSCTAFYRKLADLPRRFVLGALRQPGMVLLP